MNTDIERVNQCLVDGELCVQHQGRTWATMWESMCIVKRSITKKDEFCIVNKSDNTISSLNNYIVMICEDLNLDYTINTNIITNRTTLLILDKDVDVTSKDNKCVVNLINCTDPAFDLYTNTVKHIPREDVLYIY